MWFFFAALSALFAAFTSILAKIGIEGVDSHLATAIRTVVIVRLSWGLENLIFRLQLTVNVINIRKKRHISFRMTE